MAKLKVTAFKPSGKYYTEETYTLDREDYPTAFENQDSTVKELISLQAQATYELTAKIRDNDSSAHKYAPVNDFSGFIFVLDGIFEDSESGFLTHLIDRGN